MKVQILFRTGLIISFMLAANILMSCNMLDGIKGDGNVQKEAREHDGFDRIDVGGAVNVYLTQGETYKVVIEADANLLPIIKSEVVRSTLKVYHTKNIRKSSKLNVYITMPEVVGVDLNGAVDFQAENRLSGKTLDFDCSGAVDFEINMQYDRIDIDLSGAVDGEMAGYCREIKLDISGAAEIDAAELEAEDVMIESSGASNVKVFASKYLEVEASGASGVRYKGNPKLRTSVSGAGSCRAL